MPDLYLIAHKVRGERAFDIGYQMEDGGWIIPTSGHLAHPFWTYKLADLFAYDNVGQPPDELRDHYACNDVLKARASKPARRPSFDAPTAEDL